jgi:hypothetical protein
MMGHLAPLILLAAGVVAVLTILNVRSTQKMTQSLDNLTAGVGALETAAAAAVTEIASLKAGSDDAALDALTSRVGAVATSLTNAIAPPVAPPAS